MAKQAYVWDGSDWVELASGFAVGAELSSSAVFDYVATTELNVGQITSSATIISPTASVSDGLRNIYVSSTTASATDGLDGDIWMVYL